MTHRRSWRGEGEWSFELEGKEEGQVSLMIRSGSEVNVGLGMDTCTTSTVGFDIETSLAAALRGFRGSGLVWPRGTPSTDTLLLASTKPGEVEDDDTTEKTSHTWPDETSWSNTRVRSKGTETVGVGVGAWSTLWSWSSKVDLASSLEGGKSNTGSCPDH